MILLDTHTFIWLNLNMKRVNAKIVRAVKAEYDLALATVSLWEIGMLDEYKKISLPYAYENWVEDTLKSTGVQLLPLTKEIAMRTNRLPMHGDPVDQVIAATALIHKCRLATEDRKLLNLPWLRTIK